MVADLGTVWLGLEYFCNEGDELWSMADDAFKNFAIDELCKINFIDKTDILDHTIIRILKAYPAYFGTYNQFSVIKEFTDTFSNLFLIGRNGMHRYNNADHSMMTAIHAVQNIQNNIKEKDALWNINIGQEYHETKASK